MKSSYSGAAAAGHVLVRALLVLLTFLSVAGCATSSTGSPSGATASPAASDPFTRSALLRVSQQFNDNYDNGQFGAVWDRWDRRSRALISRAEYIRRHEVCAPATGVSAKVEGATAGGQGAWHVRYEIGGMQFADTWYYRDGRWVFDIVKSNPDAAKHYAMPFAQYVKAVGCSIH